MTLIPVFVSAANNFSPRTIVSGDSTEANTQNISRMRRNGGVNQLNTQPMNIEYVVQFDSTLEHRIRCPTFQKLLSECQLEKCTKGALPMSVSDSQWSYNGQVCVKPFMATVQEVQPHTESDVTLCNCLRVATAIVSLEAWKVKVDEALRDECILQLGEFKRGKSLMIKGLHDNLPDKGIMLLCHNINSFLIQW